ncbi:MAG TPA: 2OG-Fe(II) oxygenase [Gammaproteobacteria bacterium]|nr:2OG-Fe(II) oxygenase [Gammaproteobacteria bacterium]
MPPFERKDGSGHSCSLFNLHYGQPIVLLASAHPRRSFGDPISQALLTQHPLWQRITRIAILKTDIPGCASLTRQYVVPFTMLADDGTLTSHLLGKSADQHTAALFALDNNLRVIRRWDAGSLPDAASVLRELESVYGAPDEPQAVTIRGTAPVLLIPRVFDEEFCAELIAAFERDGGQPSGVYYIENGQATWKPDPTIKARRDYYLPEEDPLTNRIRDLLARRVLPEVKRCFNYQILQHEPFKLIRYDGDTGGYFRPHRDNESRDSAHRRFAMTINLNTGDYEGGQLQFPEFGPYLYEAERGGAIVFSCSLVHEAKPVISGRRYALLSFFFGDEPVRQVVVRPQTSASLR